MTPYKLPNNAFDLVALVDWDTIPLGNNVDRVTEFDFAEISYHV